MPWAQPTTRFSGQIVPSEMTWELVSPEQSFHLSTFTIYGFPFGTGGKEPACQCRRREIWVPSLGLEDPLEKGMATHSSIFAWRIP